MKHLKKGRQFNRPKKGRKALLRALANSLIEKEKIETTEARAKELRSVVEKMVTRARTDSLSNRRLIISRLGKKSADKLISEIAPRYKERRGGYTRVVKLPPRKGDAAKRAIIEFV